MIEAIEPVPFLDVVGPDAARLPGYVVGLDLGQASDFTALVVAEVGGVRAAPVLDVRHIERVPLGTRYPAVVSHVCATVAALRGKATTRRVPIAPGYDAIEPAPRPRVTLAVDYTGVGRPVADMIVAAKPAADLVLATITGGTAVTRGDRGEWRIPKGDLVGAVAVLLSDGRLRIAEGLPMAAVLTEELTGFRAKIGATGHVSYEAGADWRSADHDDLVLALAMACWCVVRPRPVARIR